MTDTKTCTYQSCRNVFSRPPGTADGTWKQITRCEPCRNRVSRERQTRSRQPETTLGRYTFPAYLDVFLYRTKPTEAKCTQPA